MKKYYFPKVNAYEFYGYYTMKANILKIQEKTYEELQTLNIALDLMQ